MVNEVIYCYVFKAPTYRGSFEDQFLIFKTDRIRKCETSPSLLSVVHVHLLRHIYIYLCGERTPIGCTLHMCGSLEVEVA